MIDRKIAPSTKLISTVDFVKAQKITLANNTPLYSINAGSQDLIKIEWLFDAGSRFNEQHLTANAANSLLKEGTKKMKSSEIAEKIDYYGAFLETECNKDSASVTLYSLNKHLPSTLPVVEDILKNAIFSEHEFDVYKQNSKQKLLVNNQKVDVLVRNHFNEIIFGKEHPYGVITQANDYDALQKTSIGNFYSQFYQASNCKIIVAGLVKDDTLKLIESYFGGNDWVGKTSVKKETIAPTKVDKKQHLILKEDAVQSAIRIGKILFNKTHPDYFGMQVLNTILGGYFGSRLMNNIREDKGYTYGIGSAIASMQQGGYFFISTEVGVDVCQLAIDEIYLEIKKLRDELVPEDELELVRNYLLGTFIRSIDGAFALAEKFDSMLEYGLDYSYYDNYLHTIRTITPAQLRDLANKYLQQDELIEVVVGKK